MFVFVCLYLYGMKTCCKHGFELYISFLLPLKSLTDAIRFMTSADPFLSVCPCMFFFRTVFLCKWDFVHFYCIRVVLVYCLASTLAVQAKGQMQIRQIIITNFCLHSKIILQSGFQRIHKMKTNTKLKYNRNERKPPQI